MDLKKLIEYKNWADHIYLKYCESLSDDALRKQFSGYNNSIYSILRHIYEVQHSWLEMIGMEVKAETWDNWDNMDSKYLIDGIKTLNDTLVEFMKNNDLSAEKTLQWEETDNPVITTHANIIFNLVTHNAYHRGQIAVFLRMLGHSEIKATDFNPYVYEISQE